MTPVEKWNATFDKIIEVVRKKIAVYEKDLERYEVLIPRDKAMYKDRILDLRNKVEFYEDVLYKYEHPETVSKDEIVGDVFISPYVKSKDMEENEFGVFPIIYQKSKQDLIKEYYSVIGNLNDLKLVDKNNKKTYKELSEQYYFRYAALVKEAPMLRKGYVQDQILDPGTEDKLQEYINTYCNKKRLAATTDYKIEDYVSRLNELQEQLMNFSSKNSVEKNELKIEIAETKCIIAGLKIKRAEYENIANSALLRKQAVQGEISRDYFAFLITKLDLDYKVDSILLNIESLNASIDKNDAELRVIALSDEQDEEKRASALKSNEELEAAKDKAYKDLSKARKNRLKREIIHAYNVGSISLEEKEAKLALLDSFVVINEAVEKEVSIYSIEVPNYNMEEGRKTL